HLRRGRLTRPSVTRSGDGDEAPQQSAWDTSMSPESVKFPALRSPERPENSAPGPADGPVPWWFGTPGNSREVEKHPDLRQPARGPPSRLRRVSFRRRRRTRRVPTFTRSWREIVDHPDDPAVAIEPQLEHVGPVQERPLPPLRRAVERAEALRAHLDPADV